MREKVKRGGKERREERRGKEGEKRRMCGKRRSDSKEEKSVTESC